MEGLSLTREIVYTTETAQENENTLDSIVSISYFTFYSEKGIKFSSLIMPMKVKPYLAIINFKRSDEYDLIFCCAWLSGYCFFLLNGWCG